MKYTVEELREILEKHKLWLDDAEGGERADMQCADMQGADMDYSCWPLWCGSLRAHVDDRIAIQLLYHTLSVVQHSPYVSEEIKRALLTDAVVEVANRFHRVDECGVLTVFGKEEGNP